MIDYEISTFDRHGKTILSLMQTILAGQDELKEKGYFRYVALLSRNTNIDNHCKALDYFIKRKMIDSYKRKQIKGKSAWYIEVYKNK